LLGHRDLPRGLDVGRDGPAHVRLEDVLASDAADPARVDAGYRALLDRTARDPVDVGQRVRELDVAPDRVDLEVEQVGHRLDRVTERRRRLDDVIRVSGRARLTTPAELVLVGVAGPHPDVERLEDL